MTPNPEQSERLLALAARVEAAEGPDRELDRAIGFAIGLGVEKERKLYVEMGAAMWVPTPELKGLTPYDRARGSTVRSEWVKGSRGRKGHYQDVRWGACDGPMPLTNSPVFTASLDAAMTLVPEIRNTMDVFSVECWTGNGIHAPHVRASAWVPGAKRTYAATPALALTAACLRARARAGDGA